MKPSTRDLEEANELSAVLLQVVERSAARHVAIVGVCIALAELLTLAGGDARAIAFELLRVELDRRNRGRPCTS